MFIRYIKKGLQKRKERKDSFITQQQNDRKKSEGACGRMSQNLESICVNGAMQSIHIYRIKVVVKCKIVSEKTVLTCQKDHSAHAHTHTHKLYTIHKQTNNEQGR